MHHLTTRVHREVSNMDLGAFYKRIKYEAAR
jgi:hypothetical protein